jgi:hypothetical protein
MTSVKAEYRFTNLPVSLDPHDLFEEIYSTSPINYVQHPLRAAWSGNVQNHPSLPDYQTEEEEGE